MIRINYNKVVAVMAAAFVFFSCSREEVDHSETKLIELPDHFPDPVYQIDEDAISAEGMALGRKLFYDPVLSLDSSISCGSCHSQAHAFADHNIRFSPGVNGAPGTRNTPALSNLAWHSSFMLDGGVNHLEVVPIAPITAENEMNISLVEVLERLNQHSFYKKAFEQVYGEESIDTRQLMLALTEFQLTMISADSKYDQFVKGEASFSSAESSGYNLFMQNCSSCHQPPLFSDFSFANNGLDSVYRDPGRARITLHPADSGAFKVPSLRNVELTYPYMHDGRFFSLEGVIDHYSDNLIHTDLTDSRLTDPIDLNAQQRQDLIAFLKTLTDYSFISDYNLSEP